MPTIIELTKQIETLRTKSQSESQQAQREHQKAGEAQSSDSPNEMQSHLNASSTHDQAALAYEKQIADLQIDIQRLEDRAAKLMQQREGLTASYNQELSRLNAEIQQITGQTQ